MLLVECVSGDPNRVAVSGDDPGDDGLSAELDDFRVRADVPSDLTIAPRREDEAIPNRQSGDDSILVVHREDFPADKHRVSYFLRDDT
jgi:hypothetical protein